jgi:hypothetical protein
VCTLCWYVRYRVCFNVTVSAGMMLSYSVSLQGADGSSFFLIHTRRIRYWIVVRLIKYTWNSLLEISLSLYIHVDFAAGASLVLVYTREFRFWSFFCLSIYTWTSLLEFRLS